MSAFTVTVRTPTQRFSYQAIGTDSTAVHMAALDLFGLCAVTVKPV